MAGFRRYGQLLLACIILAGVLRGQDKIGQWTIQYQTKALEVVAIDQTGAAVQPAVTVTLANRSGRPVTAFAVYDHEGQHYGELSGSEVLNPGATTTVELREPGAGVEWVMNVAAVLFGDAPRAGDGDPGAVEHMRFERLGWTLGYSRCSSVLQGLDPSALSDANISAAVELVRKPVRPLESALALLPESDLKGKIQTANAEEADTFLTALEFSQSRCGRTIEQLLAKQGPLRSQLAVALKRQQQKATDVRRALSELDMGVVK